jgi:DNA primase
LIPSETVDLIRERVDIVDVIGAVVELRRAGVNHKGLCPFHQEKTPSFNVNQARQMYHCFGCGVGGDVFTFVMAYEGRTFADAVRALGARAGVAVEEQDAVPGQKEERARRRSERERLVEVMEAAAALYGTRLEGRDGARAREYLVARGIGDEMVRAFGLGYAPEAWDTLAASLRSLKITTAEADRAGLISERRKGDGYYDRFRDRLIFPVRDAAGRVIALGGRVLPGAPPDAPKYVNSPESPIFSKSRTLYGLHLAREGLRRREPPIVVEGNVDVITMHAYGFTTAVAPMGTALTSEHVALLRRFAGQDATVILLFDGDAAGRHAVLRAQPALAEGGLGAKVALLPPEDDPDTFLRRHGAAAMTRLLSGAKGLVEHVIDEAARETGGDVHGKARGIRALAPVLASIVDPMEKDLARRHVARAFGVDERVVFKHLAGGETGPAPGGQEAAEPRAEGRRKAEATLVGALLDAPALVPEAMESGARDLVRDTRLAWILEKLDAVAAGALTLEEVIDQAPAEAVGRRIRARLVTPTYSDVAQARHALEESLTRLKSLVAREGVERLDREIAEAQMSGDTAGAAALAQKKLLAKKRAAGRAPGGVSEG